jgi:hypothetical protein
MPILRANRNRPRVALVGEFDSDQLSKLQRLFPTTWSAENLSDLSLQISPNELDLVIIAPKFSRGRYDNVHLEFVTKAHLICFALAPPFVPGPSENTQLKITKKSSTEEYEIPDLPLESFSLLENNLSHEQSAKGWPILDVEIHYRTADDVSDEDQRRVIVDGSLVTDPHTKLPFATVFNRMHSRLGVAWLPIKSLDLVPWVELICSRWADDDKEKFPTFGDWTKDMTWMTHEEELLMLEIDKLRSEQLEKISHYEMKISKLSNELLEMSLLINSGKRRLITAQGDDLLGEVANAFSDLGYSVTKMDNVIEAGLPKREDLRIRDPGAKDWEALVEVRGHLKSSGQTSDLTRLAKFARHYQSETGRVPSKLIYVVNGQIEVKSPESRQMPFASAPDDVRAIAEQDGLIIWTLELFKALKHAAQKADLPEIRKSIRESTGIWNYAEKQNRPSRL